MKKGAAPQRRKNNDFRFKTFSERISEIDIRKSAFYHITHKNEDVDDEEATSIQSSCFHQCYIKWSSLNLTEEFENFSKEIRKIITLPQVLHKKDFIIEHLLKNLENATQLSLETLFEFIVALVNDIQKDFYPYFYRFLDILISHLNQKNPDILEWTLICLASLFKILKSQIKKDIPKIFKVLIDLFDETNKPIHIVNFASECFSFVTRDIRDKQLFLETIIEIVEKNPNTIAGCGRLFFEIIRGVNGKFHSSAEIFLPLYLKNFNNKKINQDIYFEIINQTVTDMILCINLNEINLFWKIMFESLDEIECLLKEKSEDDLTIENAMGGLFKLIGQIAEHKNGSYIQEPAILIDHLVRDLNWSEKISMIISNLSSVILISYECIKLQQHDCNRLCRAVLSTSYQRVFESFIGNTIDWNQFTIIILPEFLKYTDLYYSDECLKLIGKILLKKTCFNINGIEFEKWKKYPLIFKKSENCVKEIQNHILMKKSFKDILNNDCSLFIYSLMFYINSENINREGIHLKISELLVEGIKEIKEDYINSKYFLILSSLIQSIILLDIQFDVRHCIDVLLLSFNGNSTNDYYILQIIDFIITSNKNIINFKDIQKIIEKFLLSPHHEHRLIVLHIFKNFDSIYDDVYQAETIKTNVYNYRDKLQILDKISSDSMFFNENFGKSDNLMFVPLRYYFGCLYENFKLLWEPISNMIVGYWNNYPNDFWNIFQLAFDFCEKNLRKITETNNQEIDFNDDLLNEIYKNFTQIDNRIDYVNYRILLLDIIGKCENLLEIKNREIVQKFLNFTQNELNYKKTNQDFVNLSKPEFHEKILKKPTQNTLIAYLKIFSKASNPKTFHQESILKDLYYELLLHKSPDVQKLALDCLISYKYKYITPYKDHLYNIIDEKSYKNEFIHFKIDKDSKVIADEHREEFLNVLMKILYSRMGTKFLSKKDDQSTRKSLILRFISNCNNDEIFTFIKLFFEDYKEFTKFKSLPEIISNTKTTINLESFYHPKKLQSSINFINKIFEILSGQMDDKLLKYMISIFFGITSIVQEVICNHFNEVSNIFQNSLKIVRNDCFNTLINFFQRFEEYKWTNEEIDCVFDVFIWPGLEDLHKDSIHKPTALLKLFIEFGKNPKYHLFLSKSNNNQQTPIQEIIKLFNNSKISPMISLRLMEFIENLLTLEVDDESAKNMDNIKIGHQLLLPYLNDILNKIHSSMAKKTKKTISRRSLRILTHITTLVKDSNTSNKLLPILLNILIAKARDSSEDEQVIYEMITTVTNLMQQIENPEIYLREILPLFENVNVVNTRKLLCNLLYEVTSINENSNLKKLSEITIEMNAMNKRWVEQPDYEKRLECMKKLHKMNENNEIDINLCLVIIYNSFHFLKYDKDLSIRDSSSFLLKSVVPNVINKHEDNKKEIQYLIGDVILNLIRRTISDKNRAYRSDGLAFLGELVRECSEHHQILKDLHPLSDKNERDNDFFDNIIHLQQHNHGKALRKFCTIAKRDNYNPIPRTLTQFILPITSNYLFNETYEKYHALIETCAQTVGAVCQLLPWVQYEFVLKYHLKLLQHKIDYQKQVIRLIISILDSFHFDLSKTNIISTLPKLQDIEHIEKVEIQDVPEEQELNDEDEDKEKSKIQKSKMIILSKKSANRLIEIISREILPALNNSIVKLTISDKSHKFMKRKKMYEKEEEDKLRVPIALAMVKLLQKLPEGMLENNIQGIFMKITTFLKSHIKSIRMLARDILRKIMLEIGPVYLESLLNLLSSLLTRGFQVHVLTVTVHNILDALKSEFKMGDIDKNLKSILAICMEDIFGKPAEEKEIKEITSSTPEAKSSSKSFMSLNILARNITESCLLDLIMPIKTQLSQFQSKKVVIKAQQALQKISTGLIENENISLETLFTFVYGIISESITDLFPSNKNQKTEMSEREKLRYKKADIFLIQEVPNTRSTEVKRVVKTNNQANAHVLIEFGLEILHLILKRDQYKEINYVQYMNPLIPILTKTLTSQHIKVSTHTLKCISVLWNNQIQLSNLKINVNIIVNEMFNLLNKYSSIQMSSNDDNYHLVKSIFKAMIGLLKFVDYHTLNEDQLKVLLLYIEQYLNNIENQSFAFLLLNAILVKKLQTPELEEVMKQVCRLNITSDSAVVRDETRSIFLKYIMNYPLGDKVQQHIIFYVKQLNYETILGRKSVIYMIKGFIQKFPITLLNENSALLLLSLGAAIVNEEESDCRILLAETIEELLNKVDKNQLNALFDIITTLIKSNKISQNEMAAQLIVRFVNVEKEKFTKRLRKIFPIILSKLTFESPTGRFVKIQNSNNEDDDDDEDDHMDYSEKVKLKDHSLIQIQNAILSILEECPKIFNESKLYTKIDELAYESQKLLNHDHVWVRLNSLKILEKILSKVNTEKLEKTLLDDENSEDTESLIFIYMNPLNDLKSLTTDQICLLFPGDTMDEMAEQVMKNLVYIANFIKNVPFKKSENDEKSKINLIWLIKKVRSVINSEIVNSSNSIVIREAAFNWISAIITLLDKEKVKELSHLLLPPLVREMSEEDTTVNPILRQKANKIGNKIKQKIGEMEFNTLRSNAQRVLLLKRAERKKHIAQEKINNPEKAIKRKIHIQHKKKESKKRRLDIIRGKGNVNEKRKRKFKEMDL